ncbi:MAG: hypothetical protein QXF20_03000 [Candidatus Hadarchaeales archaeon]
MLVEHGRWISQLLNDFRVLEQRLEHLEKRVGMLEECLRRLLEGK